MADNLESQKGKIVELLKEKAVMKQDVFRNATEAFEMLKVSVNDIATGLTKEVDDIDKRISIGISETKKYSIQLKVAGDVLEFFMHTNVFEFDHSHPMYKTGYIKHDENNSYCGIINVYNFLADSFKYNRFNDLGYLICRIFVNREKHFFIEAKGPLGAKYSGFSAEPITQEQLTEIINDLIIYAITFDLFTPPFEQVKEVSVGEIQEKMNSINLRTGKRLGYEAHTSGYQDDTNLYI